MAFPLAQASPHIKHLLNSHNHHIQGLVFLFVVHCKQQPLCFPCGDTSSEKYLMRGSQTEDLIRVAAALSGILGLQRSL